METSYDVQLSQWVAEQIDFTVNQVRKNTKTFYRFDPETITALKEIAWWNWSRAELEARYPDFRLPIEDFVVKYTR